MKIGFIGNFAVSYSTENERRKAFEELGHTVIQFQENQTTAEQLLLADVDLLVYSHTHDPSYVIPNLKEVFAEYKRRGIPTASAHLDRWAGLARVSDVGNEATWFTEYIFMADGSPEAKALYDKYNLNWYYLPPAVASDQCFLPLPDEKKYPHDIIFVGSKGYHPEYSFRPLLIDFLQQTYGERFGHYGNDGIAVVREKELNTLYVSSKIAVGDSCFGGRPFYVSDRYYETRGRGGFLLHPQVEGVDDVGVAHYQGLDELKAKIDYYLEHAKEREQMRMAGYTEVKRNHTYTDRARRMLEVIGL